MAKHKRKRTKYVSKGERTNVSKQHLKWAREGNTESIVNKIAAWRKGKRGYITIANPNKNETNRRFIKVTFNQFFGGAYKDIRTRIKQNVDNDRIELAL